MDSRWWGWAEPHPRIHPEILGEAVAAATSAAPSGPLGPPTTTNTDSWSGSSASVMDRDREAS